MNTQLSLGRAFPPAHNLPKLDFSTSKPIFIRQNQRQVEVGRVTQFTDGNDWYAKRWYATSTFTDEEFVATLPSVTWWLELCARVAI